jgi:hypothetical protein
MSKHRAALRVEVKPGEKSPNPFIWEIYRGSEPMCLERAMHGYPTGLWNGGGRPASGAGVLSENSIQGFGIRM